MTDKTAIITGITGQYDAYLADPLLEKGYTVYETFRRTSSVMFSRIEELGIDKHPRFHRDEYSLLDPGSTIRHLEKAAPRFLAVSVDQPIATGQTPSTRVARAGSPSL